MHTRELLLEPVAYQAPTRALEGLEPALADRRVDGIAHSIAELVAHLSFWQEWFLRRCQGIAEPPVARAAEGWPAVTPGTWPDIQQRFVDRLSELTAWGEAAGGELDAPIAPAIEFPPLAQYTRRDALVHVATHNAHHLGQVILLRQMLGAWPPPAGSWTW